MTIDTSKEAVERLALLHEGIVFAEATGSRQCLVDVDDARFLHVLAADRAAQTARADAAEAEVARLRKVYWQLRSYATHDDKCKLNKAPSFTGPCSCGLSEATKAGE